jgi:hypothetical protein
MSNRSAQGAADAFWSYAKSMAAQAPVGSWTAYNELQRQYDRALPDVDWQAREADMAKLAQMVGV